MHSRVAEPSTLRGSDVLRVVPLRFRVGAYKTPTATSAQAGEAGAVPPTRGGHRFGAGDARSVT